MESREIPKIKEVTREDLQQLCQELFGVQAMLETVALALYHVQDEPEPISKAVTISFAVEKAAKDCEALKAIVDDMAERTR